MRKAWQLYLYFTSLSTLLAFFQFVSGGVLIQHPVFFIKAVVMTVLDLVALYSYAARRKLIHTVIWQIFFFVFIGNTVLDIFYNFHPLPQLSLFFDSGKTYSIPLILLMFVINLPFMLPDLYVVFQLGFRSSKAFEKEKPPVPDTRPTSRLAKISAFLGLTGFLFAPLTFIPAIVTGIIALIRMKFTKKRGRNWALFGIVASVYQVLIWSCIAFLLMDFLIFSNSGKDLDRAMNKMTENQRTLYTSKLSKITTSDTKEDVKRIMGDPGKESEKNENQYAYDCPDQSLFCYIFINFSEGKVSTVSMIDFERFIFSFLPAEKRSDVTYIQADDPRILQAKKDAQSNINQILTKVKSNDCYKNVDCMVKYDFVEDGIHEHMWITVFYMKDGVLYGTLRNTPEVVPSLHLKDAIHVKIEDIEDWLFYDGTADVIKGGYSIISAGSEKDLEQFKSPETRTYYEDTIKEFTKVIDKKHADYGWNMNGPMIWRFHFHDSDKSRLQSFAQVLKGQNFDTDTVEYDSESSLFSFSVQERAKYTPVSFYDRWIDMSNLSLLNNVSPDITWNVDPASNSK